MATAREDEDGRFWFDYPEGPSREVKLAIIPGHGENLIQAVVCDENGDIKANPVRLKGADGGQRVAADFPTFDPNSEAGAYLILDGSGRITNG